MKIRRKTNQCFNCGTSLDGIYNYCPKCGQENNDNNVSVKTLLGDFFNTYLAIDSRFGRTLKPFFIKPGFLTNKYSAGKRVTYAHPLRLYLIISIFYFFTVTIAIRHMIKDEDGAAIQTSSTKVTLSSIKELNEVTRENIVDQLTGSEKKLLSKKIKTGNIDSLKAFLAELDTVTQAEIRSAIGDSTANELNLVYATVDSNTTDKEDDDDINIELGDDESFILNEIDYEEISRLDKEYPELGDEQIYDSLNMGELGYWDNLFVRQAIRVNRSRQDEVLSYVAKNLPLMMLILIPLFAAVLKLLYIRRNELYIKHIIHALHLHSYAYLIYGIFILVTINLINDENISSIMNSVGFLIVSVYSFISFRKVYGQHWFKTLIKFLLVGWVYFFAIIFFFLVEMVISLLLY